MSLFPESSFKLIDKELDKNDWILEQNKSHIQIYSKQNASDSNVIGFKTVTEHAIAPNVIFELLKDVCGVMNQINNLYLLGEVFMDWPIELDSLGKLVRTSFKMPFPFSNREFLHGLHSYQKNNSTFIVAYTPVEESEIPIQSKFVRCPMYISGQRITVLNSGLVRVEHLMTYRLGGSISAKMQDSWLKKSHVGAYAKEWENLGTTLFPPKLDNIEDEQLTAIAKECLQTSTSWPTSGKAKYGTVKVGHFSFLPQAVFRLDLVVDASIEQVVNVLADQSLKYLPQWNREFLDGEIIKTIEESSQKSAWLIRVHYKTPFFLANREYIYYFSREWLSADEALIIYNSIEHDSVAPKQFVRALLYPTIHRCLRLQNGKTKIEHVLSTDLKGKLGGLQNSLLKGGLIQAQYRDMEKQYALFASL